MTEQQSSYRQIFKATSIFGGVKVFEIVISIIRTKIVAVLLGPEGMGIQGLFTSTIALITGLTNFGLGTSAVKNVAAANESGDGKRVATVIKVLRRIVWITGFLGTIVTLILAPYLSKLTFGSDNYTWGFVWLSVTLLLNQISTGQIVLLRGLRKINYLAKSSLSGAVLGLIISVPIYYFLGIDGIVPAIILTSIATLARTWYFSRKIKVEKVKVDTQTTFAEGKDMLIMGFMLSISGLYVLAKNYGIRAFIGNLGGLEQVGLYTAGFAIVNTYVGMVFTAMSTDYFPRLSAIAYDNQKARELINQQAEIAILILAPIITIFIVFISWIIVLLYSDKFTPINQMVQWAALGMFFKAISWSMAFIFLAKGASKLYLANELFGGTITLICNLLGFFWWGLTGMGIGFLLGYFFYTIQVFLVIKRKFNYSFSYEIVKIFFILFAVAFVSLLFYVLFSPPINYIFGGITTIFSIVYSIKALDKRIDLKKYIKWKKNIYLI